MEEKRYVTTALIAASGRVAIGPRAGFQSGCELLDRSLAVTYTNGGYEVVLSRYTSMGNPCSAVRYVMNNWVRRKIARQWGRPRISGPFYDGYVTWHCWKLSGTRWQCDEYDSGYSFRFTAYYR